MVRTLLNIQLLFYGSFIVFVFEQKCQAKGQKMKLDNIKERKIVSLLILDKKTANTL
jgi:hypothetical protein